MSIAKEDKSRLIPGFKIIWAILTLAVAFAFAFGIYPRVYRVNVLLYVKQEGGYSPNTAAFRRDVHGRISDDPYLYYSRCDVLPLGYGLACDRSRSWVKVSPEEVACKDVISCGAALMSLPEWRRNHAFTDIPIRPGEVLKIPEGNAVPWQLILHLGEAGRWPLFVLLSYLGLILGRAILDFGMYGSKDRRD